MSRKHEKTLEALFADPIRANISWNDVVSALSSLGVESHPLRGSKVAFVFNGTRHVIHKPHPGNQLKKPVVRAFREFCVAAGIGPEPNDEI